MPDLRKCTKSPKAEDIERSWYVLDAKDQILGRAATRIAGILLGKHKPTFAPHVDCGDFVVVVNARHVKITGRKTEQKIYHTHTGYTGHVRSFSTEKMMERHPDQLFRKVVQGMLPKTALGRRMLRKLKVYADAEHPHEAQQPARLEVRR